MREETIKLYSFNELSEEAKENAITKWREGIEWGLESSQITESFQHELDSLGYPTKDVNWSLSYSQGDGVAFYGVIDGDGMDEIAERLLEGQDKELYFQIIKEGYSIDANIYRNAYGHRYSHWNTMSVDVDGDDIDTIVEGLFNVKHGDEDYDDYYIKVEGLFTIIEESISHDIKRVSKDLEKQGYDEIEYIESDEHIIEVINANDYEFTEDGVMY